MSEIKKSRRGVYYDLSISPYEFKTPYGDIFKFSSCKKLEIYTREIENELKRLDKVLQRNRLSSMLPCEIQSLIRRLVYRALYRSIEG